MSNGFNTDGIYTIPQSKSPTMNCLESIECAIAFDVRDWSEDKRSAWIYGIVFGWDDDDSENEIQNKFHWDDEDIIKLKQYHAEWERVKSIIEKEIQNDNNR